METRGATAPVLRVSRLASLTVATKQRGAIAVWLGIATALAAWIVLILILASGFRAEDLAAAGHIPLAWTALVVISAVILIGFFTRGVRIDLGRRFPWIVFALSVLVSLGTWLVLAAGNEALAASIYRGLRIPQGIVQFWDMSLVMLSVDCARFGFDIYQDNNGCMQDASIYAPGMVWLRFMPFSLFSQDNVPALGAALIVVSSLALAWLARQSTGSGQIVLAIAAVGAPWVLLLERGNIDAVVLVVLVAGIATTRRWSDSLIAWFVAAGGFWLMGTWKYYPFVLGLALLPVLRLRRGWTVIAAYLIAAFGYLVVTWQNFLFSSQSNSNMIDFGDWAVLGRVPLVARMIDATPGAEGLQVMDIPVIALTLLAITWGVAVARALPMRRMSMAALASAASALYLASVFVAGFGYGYKAAFLLAGVPLIASFLNRGTDQRARALVGSSIAVLVLIAVQSVIMWNTVLATSAGLIAAGFLLGAGTAITLAGVLPAVVKSRQALKA